MMQALPSFPSLMSPEEERNYCLNVPCFEDITFLICFVSLSLVESPLMWHLYVYLEVNIV